MASIVTRRDGIRFVQVFVELERHRIRLGRVSRKIADKTLIKVEELVIAKKFDVLPEPDVVEWLTKIDSSLYARLQKATLIGPRHEAPNPTLGEWCETFLATYPAGGTKGTLVAGFMRLRKHFGDDRPLRTIDDRAAKACRAALLDAGYAIATVGNTIRKARQLWSEAVDRGAVDGNPWQEVEAGEQANPKRAFYIDLAASKKLLAACPDAEWRLIFALCRFGGLRCPSEIVKLTCEDVSWDRDRFHVHGKGALDREVPIFARLRPHLEAVVKKRKAGPLVGKSRRGITGTALRWQFERIIQRAGLTQWPRIFHNLRASCETDLASEGYPPHVYGQWLGNSAEVARRHYLQATDKHFAQAAGGSVGKGKAKRA